jgi:hypothetical protein
MPVCGEVLILRESVIRHTQAKISLKEALLGFTEAMNKSRTVHFPGGSFQKSATMSLAFYEANYDLVFHAQLKPGKKGFLGSKSPRICRFCGRRAPEVSFKKDAHAVSRLTGNNVFFTYEECSLCNEIFSKVEDDLGKFTLLKRVSKVCKRPEGDEVNADERLNSRYNSHPAGSM